MSDYKICNQCGASILEAVTFCPKCGSKQDQPLSDDEKRKNPYNILQISPDAEPEVIEAAYKSLARKYHPDAVGSSASEGRMKDINWAHDILTDPYKKNEWNQKREQASRPTQTSPSHVQPEPYRWKTTEDSNESDSKKFQQSHKSTQKTTTQRVSQVYTDRRPTKKISWGTIIIGAILAFSLIAKISNAVQRSSAQRYSTSASGSARNSGAISSPDCVRWDEVTYDDVGKRLCVYGEVLYTYNTSGLATVIKFSKSPSAFIMYDEDHVYEDLTVGICVRSDGYIVTMYDKPAINLNGKLYERSICK